MTEATGKTTRAQRLAMPLAREVVRDLAVEHGACIRPIQLRRTNLDAGAVDQVLVPCGHTLARVCPACADRAKTLRAAQCREGWHLEDEPGIHPDPATEEQKWWITLRAEAQQHRDQAEQAGHDTTDFDELITELDAEITTAGLRGKVSPARPARRHRSTRRRQDTPDLPRRKISPRTVGKTYTAPDGKTFRPSLFVTLTLPVVRAGRRGRGTRRPAAYEYDRAARDALHFAALFDRFIQNLRRYLGYDLQYFAAVEPQRRLAPHVHIAMRGTVARAEIRRVLAATYHQVWWPDTSPSNTDGGELPVWDDQTRGYLDPATGEVLPTWDQALDELGRPAAPRGPVRGSVRRPGRARRIQGRGPVHRLPDQVPDQAGRRLPPRRHRPRARPRRPAGRGTAVPAVLAAVRELAAVRHPAQEPPARPGPRPVQGQGPRPRSPRLRRSAGAGLPQVVRQDAGRPPGRPQGMAADDARCFGNRPGPVRLGTRCAH